MKQQFLAPFRTNNTAQHANNHAPQKKNVLEPTETPNTSHKGWLHTPSLKDSCHHNQTSEIIPETYKPNNRRHQHNPKHQQHISDLSNVTLIHAFGFLSLFEKLKVRTISHSWNELGTFALLITKCLDTVDCLTSEQYTLALKITQKWCPRMACLKVDVYPSYSAALLNMIPICRKIESVQLYARQRSMNTNASPLLESVGQHLSGLRILSLFPNEQNNCTWTIDQGALSFISVCRGLEALYAGAIEGDANDDVFNILKNCPNLRVLALHDAKFSLENTLSKLETPPKNIRHLSLVACGVTNYDCATIADQMPTIRELTLDTIHLDDYGAFRLMDGALSNLEMLSLNNTCISNATLQHLSSPRIFPKLQTLCLWCSSYLSPKVIDQTRRSRRDLLVISDEDEEPEECFVFVEVCRRAGVKLQPCFDG